MNRFLEEIQQQPEALRATGVYLQSNAGSKAMRAVARRWQSGQYNAILLTGMGSSHFIAEAAATLMSARGLEATAIDTGELLHYQKARITHQTLLVCISQSGESYEVVKLLEHLDSNITVVGITNSPGSTLARLATHCLYTQAGIEQMTSTKTFITCYQMVVCLTNALVDFAENYAAWEKLAETITPIVGGEMPWLEHTLALIQGTRHYQLIARGTTMATARQSALMFMEAAHTAASVLTGGAFRHGPIEMVDEEFVAIVFNHSKGITAPQIRTLVEDLLKFGARVVLIDDTPCGLEHEHLSEISVPCPTEELFAIPAVIPLQMLINEQMVRSGTIPGDFYHGNKVTARE